jgi:putative membrane protein
MNHLIKIIKGAFVGMGSILPGVSGSMIAAILKIYQDLITALNDFTSHPIKSILKVWQYILGVFVGLGLGFIVVKLFLENFPLPFTFLFIGFILGSIPTIKKEINVKNIQYHHILVFLFSIILMIMFLFINRSTSSVSNITFYFIIFFIGLITAIALITPGLSGATMLLALGYYQILIELVDDVFRAIVTFDLNEIKIFIPMLLILFLGVITGLIFMGKVMYKILEKYKNHFYIAVLGIIIISPFNVLYQLNQGYENVFAAYWYVWIISILLLGLGVYFAYLISNKKHKTEEIL